MFLTSTSYPWQTGDKLVRALQVAHNTDAVLISDITVLGRSVECGLYKKATQGSILTSAPGEVRPFAPFEAPSEWISKMDIALINRTQKTIVFGEMKLFFLDSGDCSRAAPCISLPIRFGNIPAVDLYDKNTKKPVPAEAPRSVINWQGEQTLVVHVKDYLPQIQQILSDANLSIASIGKLSISRGVFYFDNGMRWANGHFSVVDAGRPGAFMDAPDTFFPGHRGHNFPPGFNHPEITH